MDVLLKTVQVILALSLLVLVHEFGHFIFAKLFKMRVEKFFLFFPPTLFSFKPKNSETEFGIGTIPLGGFCKISGMVDESLDKDAIAAPPQPWEFRSHPAWQRLLVLFGGVFFNFLLAILLYSAIFGKWGEEYLKTADATYGIETTQLSREIGFMDGDRILAFDDTPQEDFNFSYLQVNLVRMQAATATVLRGSDTITFKIDEAYFPAMLNTPGMFGIRTRIAVASIPDTSINSGSGIAEGDIFCKIDTIPVLSVNEIRGALAKYPDTTIPVTFLREGNPLRLNLLTDNEGKLQVLLRADLSDIHLTKKEYGFFSSIAAGAKRSVTTVSDYVKELGLIFSPSTKAYKSVGSFISIGNIFPSSWDWQIFWNISAWLSVMLAVLNLLPIPGLDGGHILFTLWEIVSGKKPSDKFLQRAQIVGMIILLSIFILAFGNDIFRLFN